MEPLFNYSSLSFTSHLTSHYLILLSCFENVLDLKNVLIIDDVNVPNFFNLNLNDSRKDSVIIFLSCTNLRHFNLVHNSNGRFLYLVLSNMKCAVVWESNSFVPEDSRHPSVNLRRTFMQLWFRIFSISRFGYL